MIIISASASGSAFIFFGGITGTKRADADADVILNGQSAGDRFGGSVSSAGDFNGDGKDDVIVGARYDDNNSATDSGSAFIFFGGDYGNQTSRCRCRCHIKMVKMQVTSLAVPLMIVD